MTTLVRGYLAKAAATIAAFGLTLKEAFFIFWGFDNQDEKAEVAGKVAKTTSKGFGYLISDYGFSALTAVIVGLCSGFGLSESETTMVVWVYDVLVAYGFVVFSRSVVEDFTLTEAMRAAVNAMWRKNTEGKIISVFLVPVILFRFSVWDGPERVAIFLRKELPGKVAEFLFIAIFAVIQAVVWTKLYSLGIKNGWELLKFLWDLI